MASRSDTKVKRLLRAGNDEVGERKDLNFSGVAVTDGSRAPLLGGFIRDDFGRGPDLAEWGTPLLTISQRTR